MSSDNNGADSVIILAVVVRKCFIKHMCFIVLYFHSHAFFSLDIAKKLFRALFFEKCALFLLVVKVGGIFI